MTGICGWYSASSKNPRATSIATRVAGHLPGADELRHLESSGGSLVCRLQDGAIASDRDAGLSVAIEGRPRWSSAKIAAVAESQGPATALIAAYKELGHGFLSVISGPFALAIMDDRDEKVTLAIDRMGVRPMCYADARGEAVFGSNSKLIVAHGAIEPELAPQSIYSFVYFHVVPSPSTIYKAVRKLEPGQTAVFVNGSWRVDHYWKPDFTGGRDASVETLKRKMMTGLRSAISRTNPDEHTGAFLSGGLDSSTVCGLANELVDGRLPAYSIGFNQDGYDEIAFARIAADHFGLELNEYYVTADDIAEAIPIIASRYDEPFANASAVPAYFCARNAKRDGLDRLLAGDGGDELFGGNERYATQQLFEYYSRLPRFLRTVVLEPAVFGLPTDRIKLVRKLRRYIEQARVGMPERLQTYNLLHMEDAGSIFSSAFLEKIDRRGPIEDMQSWYNYADGAEFVDRMLMFDWKLTLADNDIRKVTTMCESADIDVDFPLLDDDLVDYSLQIPTHLKIRRGQLRYLFKRAMTGFLPNETINKTKHGFGLPFGEWLKASISLRNVVLPLMIQLKNRGIFKDEFIDDLITKHQSVDAAHYGKTIWVLVMLESWLQAHEQPATNAGPVKFASAADSVLAI